MTSFWSVPLTRRTRSPLPFQLAVTAYGTSRSSSDSRPSRAVRDSDFVVGEVGANSLRKNRFMARSRRGSRAVVPPGAVDPSRDLFTGPIAGRGRDRTQSSRDSRPAPGGRRNFLPPHRTKLV